MIDWMTKAAEEIADVSVNRSPQVVAMVRRIIFKHCPMAPETL